MNERTRRYWETVLFDGYQPASDAENLAFFRGILARLYGMPPLQVVDEGKCDDCHRQAARFAVGRVFVCSTCAGHRHRAKREAEAA